MNNYIDYATYKAKKADCSSGVTAFAIRDALDRAIMEDRLRNFTPIVVPSGYWNDQLESVALGETIHFNVDPKTKSEEKHMDMPTIIDLIGKYMRKAHCKKGEAIRRISEVFDYAEHHIARDISREKAINNGTLKAPIDTLHDYWLDFYHDLDKMSVEKAEKKVLIARFNQRFTRTSTNRYRIKDVIFNNPATIIFWEDGDKTVAKCKEGETYSPEVGVMVCYFKKVITAVYWESPNKALGLLSEIATFNTKGGK